MFKGAAIWFSGRAMRANCIVRELSETGCRIKTSGAEWLPDEFELALGADAIIERCEVVWRNDEEMGVRFVKRV